jgi:hypothetical protein
VKTARKLHLWLGTLFAPSIIFFAVSGAFQLLGLHEGEGATAFVSKLAQVHKDQTIDELPHKAPRPPVNAKEAAPPREGPHRSMVLMIYFLAMAIGLVFSSCIGIYLAFAYKRGRAVIIGLLAAGTIVPIVGLFL